MQIKQIRTPVLTGPSPRKVTAQVESVDDIVEGGTLPLKMPWTIRAGAAQWRAENPAEVGKTDTLTLQMTGGTEAQVEILRNGASEFHAAGSQGAHDVDHVYFESCWEQLGGRPLVAASPMNEVLVNAFEWVMTPQWRDGRVREMNQLREARGEAPREGLPSDEEFLDFQMHAGKDGARQLVHQTVLTNPMGRGALQLFGRVPESFPNRTELDWSMRMVTGTFRDLDSVLETVRAVSGDGLKLARLVASDQPEFVQEVNGLRSRVHELAGDDHASAVISSKRLSFSPELMEKAAPLVKRMNENLEKLPPVYCHGLNGELEKATPVIPFYLSEQGVMS